MIVCNMYYYESSQRLSKALSKLATVEENGVCRQIRRQIVAVSGDYRRRNSYKPHMLTNCSSLATFLSLTVKADVNSVTYGQLRTQQHTYVRLAALKSLSKLNRAFRVIQRLNVTSFLCH